MPRLNSSTKMTMSGGLAVDVQGDNFGCRVTVSLQDDGKERLVVVLTGGSNDPACVYGLFGGTLETATALLNRDRGHIDID